MLFLAAYLYSLFLGATYVAAQGGLAFTLVPAQAYTGHTYNITWRGGDNSRVSIDLTVRLPSDFQLTDSQTTLTLEQGEPSALAGTFGKAIPKSLLKDPDPFLVLTGGLCLDIVVATLASKLKVDWWVWTLADNLAAGE